MDDALFHGNIVNSRRILYTPSAFARSNLLHLQEIGSLTAQRPHVSRRENGKVKKRQYPIGTVGYYALIEWGLYD